jgi:hypothetical protein
MTRQPLRPRGIGELLDSSFRLYRNHFLSFITIAALMLLPYHLLAWLFSTPRPAPQAQSSGIDLTLSFIQNLSGNNNSAILGFVFGVLIEPIFYGTIVLVAALRYQQQTATLIDSFKQAFQRAISLIGALLLSVPAILLAAVPALAALCFAIQTTPRS